jgi:hypothetical protein
MKECIVCKKPFEGVRERKKFCSDLCRATYHQNIKLANGRLKFAGKSGKKAAALYEELIAEMKNIQFVKPTAESFDGEKIDRVIMDEPLQWSEPNTDYSDKIKEHEAELAGLAKGGNVAGYRRLFLEKEITRLKRLQMNN